MVKGRQENVLKFMVIVGVVIASQILVECHPQNLFEIENFNCTFDPNYFTTKNSGNCALKVVDGRNKFISGHGDLEKPIDDLNVDVKVYLESMLADGHFHLLFNISENICSLADDAKASSFALAIRPVWQQYTNAPLFECPIVAGKYYVNDIEYNDLAAEYIPVGIPNGHYKIDIKLLNKSDIVISASILLTVKKPTQSE
ncbi:uncharacterized protein LOC129577215 [Sitodiplosis mosellana]|uniref:uncharacterized protein LOC129577215 n=1 Tax=Sitodiplosis mosellana TaxID=263140 RepID=UPI0024451F45|nr:uncharacterized protein LOC129577215 [Sitodiplosis mosellana]